MKEDSTCDSVVVMLIWNAIKLVEDLFVTDAAAAVLVTH